MPTILRREDCGNKCQHRRGQRSGIVAEINGQHRGCLCTIGDAKGGCPKATTGTINNGRAYSERFHCLGSISGNYRGGRGANAGANATTVHLNANRRCAEPLSCSVKSAVFETENKAVGTGKREWHGRSQWTLPATTILVDTPLRVKIIVPPEPVP